MSLHQAPWRWQVGIEAGLALGIPLAIFTLAGRQAEGLVASLGAFTALYYPFLHRAERLRVLMLVAAAFVVASAAGAMVGPGAWLTAGVLVAVAVVATIIALGVAMGPPGPMMFVLVAGVSGTIVRSERYDGLAQRLEIPLLVAIGAGGAFIVSIAPLAVPLVRKREGRAAPPGTFLRFEALDDIDRIIAFRVIAAVMIASLVAIPLAVPRAYWVVMVAGVVLQVNPGLRRTLRRVTHRITGTVVGVGAFGLVALAAPSGIWLVLLLAALQCAVEVVVARNYGLALIFITPLALSIATAGSSVATRLVVRDRIVDTLLGAGIAIGVLLASEWVLVRHQPGQPGQ